MFVAFLHLQATFEGWMEVMEDAIDATKVKTFSFSLAVLVGKR